MAGSRLQVWTGSRKSTSGGLKKKDLIKNKNGRIVPKKKSQSGKSNKWAASYKKARASMVKEGMMSRRQMTPIGGSSKLGKELLRRTRQSVSGKGSRKKSRRAR